MKTYNILKKLYLEKKAFVKADTLKEYCGLLKLDYDVIIRYLLSRGYLIRIFRGIFYVKSAEEIRFGKTRYNHLELVSKGLSMKSVENWYFGLYTALKLNNLTHEHFATDYVVSDKIFRAKPISMAGYKFKFLKLKPGLLKFGIIKKNSLKYSDPEKTILDFVYVWKYNNIPEEKIVVDVSEWAEGLSKKKMLLYCKKYPKSVKKIVERVK